MSVRTPRFLSLRWRLMGPLLGVWAMGLVLLVGILYANILERFRTLVDQRADVMAAAVYSAAETAREPADLRRFISTLGASRDVRRVTLLAGSPLRVVAASDHGLHGKPADALEPAIVARLGEVLQSRQGWRRLDMTERRLDVLEPLLLVGSDGESGRLEDGVLQLQLDAGSLWQATRDTVIQLSVWLGAVLSAVAGLFYLMVARYVLRPAGAIRGVLAHRRETGGDLPVPVMRRDEIGELAEALNELLLTLRTRNRQLARASDQHLAMLESFPHLAWRAKINGDCDWFNRAWYDFTGRCQAEEQGWGWLDGVHPDDQEACLKAWKAALLTRRKLTSEYRLRTADGSYHWIADHGAPFFDGDGVFAGFVGSCYDLQPARDNARDIRRMKHLYQALSATNKAIVHTRDAATLLAQAARIAVEFGDLDLAWIGLREDGELKAVAASGEGAGAVLGGAWGLPGGVPTEARVFNDGAAMAGAGICVAGAPSAHGSCAVFPIRAEEGGEGVLVLRSAADGFFDAPAVSLFDEMSTDIGFALRNYRRDESLNLAARVFENNSEGFVVVAPDRQVVMINRAFTTLTGLSEEAVRGKPLVLLDPEHHPRGFATAIRDVAAEGGLWQGEVWIRRSAGDTFPADMSVSAVRAPDGEVTHYVGVFSDISQRKADEARIRFLASHDFLTGLPSRAALEDTVSGAIAAARSEACGVALCFLDLDRFKNVNDTLGHHIGDQLLVEVAQRLQSVMAEGECALRHGGDEFVVVMPVKGGREVQARAAGRLLGVLEAPFHLAGCEFTLSGSIGVAVWPEDGEDADLLLDRADMAMYRAKEEGRNAIEFFADGVTTPTSERLSLEHALRRALERNELHLHYQPVVAAEDGRLVGAEALLRWTHPELGEVSPGRFIPLAEESGLILPIGNRVLDMLCAQLAAWRAEGRSLVPVAANISALQFRRADFVETVAAVLRRHDVPAGWLTLEVTESMVMRDVERAARQLAELKALGLSIAVDDFGTGYSSLAYLKRFPLDKLKVDQSFVREINEGPEDKAIVAAIVGLGHNLGLELVAEGVETPAMAATLRELGCDEFQGWHYGRAEPADVFAARLVR
ncbi:MAG: EAL domain-containing protein [Zoogloea sp.]|uniref:bifunctional diguanylate cyclase/phosphodiesterase n=1 Tax=Zoogloea sp. TaxID=49181 RepID=UPI00261431FB|nr:EAL domain-containing protein [Zoogloea sp.]MDD2990487.1 EAL domain-containing protein [Zoogloea sp.]